MAWLLDAPSVHPVCRVWARDGGTRPGPSDRPGRCAELAGAGRGAEAAGSKAGPSRPTRGGCSRPGSASTCRCRRGAGRRRPGSSSCSRRLQARPPLWVRAQGADERALWDELTRGRAEAVGPSPARRARPSSTPTPTSITCPPSSAGSWRSRTSPRRRSPWPATPTRASAGGTPAPGPAGRRSTWPP